MSQSKDVVSPTSSTTPKHLGIALLVISMAQLMVVLDATIVNIALIRIQEDLKFSPESLQWVITSYTLAFGGFLLLGGRAGDILGRRRVFIGGIILFTIGSFAGGFAVDETTLLIARAVQGLGAAFAAPTALSLIATEFPEGKPRNRAMGVYAAMSGAGAAVGLILGGVLTEYSWRWVLFVNVPIGELAGVPSSTVGRAASTSPSGGERAIWWDSLPTMARVVGIRELAAGRTTPGPLLVLDGEAVCVVPSDWTVRVEPDGSLLWERAG